MQVQVNCGDGLQGKETLETWASDFLNESLARFRGDLTSVQVQLSDEAKGRTGASDMRCTLEARPNAHQPLAVTHHGETMDMAIRGAAQKLNHALEHAFGRLDRRQHRDRDTIRKDADAIENGTP